MLGVNTQNNLPADNYFTVNLVSKFWEHNKRYGHAPGCSFLYIIKLSPTNLTRKKKPVTYVVSKNAPSLHLSRAFLAGGFAANSTKPFPVALPRSSTTTTALSTGPNWEKACSRSSLETTGERFLTVKAAPCVANRIRSGLLFKIVPSSSVFAISASVLDSFPRGGKKTFYMNPFYTCLKDTESIY